MLIPSFVWGLAGVGFAAVSLFPYFFSTINGKTRPHVFTWAIWFVLTVITFLVQYMGGAGPGAWSTGFTCLCCLAILIASFKHGEKRITRSDWIVFIGALTSIPIWLMTKNLSVAAIWLTAIDGAGYYPTCRKSWHKPHEEMTFSHIIANVKHCFSLLAIQNYNIATTLYPVALIVLNTLMVGMIYWRRYALKHVTV